MSGSMSGELATPRQGPPPVEGERAGGVAAHPPPTGLTLGSGVLQLSPDKS